MGWPRNRGSGGKQWGMAQWLERWTHDQKGRGFESPQERFFLLFFFALPGSAFCFCFFVFLLLTLISVSVPSTPVLPQNPGHSAKSAGGGLQLNAHAPYVCSFE